MGLSRSFCLFRVRCFIEGVDMNTTSNGPELERMCGCILKLPFCFLFQLAHPTPQVTRPTTVHLPESPWQTRGLPPSPVQASFPTWPPAQISLWLRLNLFPLPARYWFKALFNLLLQLLFSTRGRSTLCWMNWKEPSTSFLPHPATQHLTPVPLLNWWLNWSRQDGRHAVFTFALFRLMSLSV